MTDLLDGEAPAGAASPGPGAAGVPGGEGVDDGPAPDAAVAVEPWWGRVWRAVTPFGRSALLAGVVCFVVGRALAWVELVAISVACLGGVAVGVVFLLAGQADLAVELALGARRVTAGDPATTRVHTTNRANRRTLPLRLEARIGRGAAHLDLPGLAAGGDHDELIVVPTSRRSVVPVGPVRSVLGDPLGLVRREIRWTGTEELFVHPRTVPLDPFTSGWRRDLEGNATNDRSPSDVAFHTLREYVAGDDRRHIHWKTTARQSDETLMVKEFVDTRRSQVAVVVSLDHQAWRQPEDLELALSTLASVGCRALDDGIDVACVAGGRVVPSGHRNALLDSLSRLELGQDRTDLVQAVRLHRDALAHASVAVVIAGSAVDDAQARRAADEFGNHARKVVIRCDTTSVSGQQASGAVATFELGQLGELPRILRAAA